MLDQLEAEAQENRSEAEKFGFALLRARMIHPMNASSFQVLVQNKKLIAGDRESEVERGTRLRYH